MNKNDAREIAQAQRLRDEIAPLHAALHNVLIVGDAHGAVLELLQVVDLCLSSRGDMAMKLARLSECRARFVISSTTTPANTNEHEVTA
jgi:hypothetical protein